VDFKSLEPLVRVLEYGADKYDDENWKKGLPFKEVCESMLRHLLEFMRGEDQDHESGESHLGHIIANAMFLRYYQQNGLHVTFDNRVNKIPEMVSVPMEDSPMNDEIVEGLEKSENVVDIDGLMGYISQKRSPTQKCPRVIVDSDEDIPDTTDGLRAWGVSEPFATGPNEYSYIVDLDTWEGRAFLEEFNKLKKERDEQ